jgi:hypothetical protein
MNDRTMRTTRANGAAAASDQQADSPGGQSAVPDLRPLLAPAEQMIAQHPVVCLASAFALGAALAWWIKRT